MQRPRAVALVALAPMLFLPGCVSIEKPRAFDAIEYRDGSAYRYRRALAEDDIPAAARRTSEAFVQPGGELLFAGSEWGRGVEAFRFDKRYGKAHRSVLVDPQGNVLERSHQIPLEHAPPSARRAAARHGDLLRVDVVQGRRGTKDLYRFTVRDDEARDRYVFTNDRGSILHHGHLTLRK